MLIIWILLYYCVVVVFMVVEEEIGDWFKCKLVEFGNIEGNFVDGGFIVELGINEGFNLLFCIGWMGYECEFVFLLFVIWLYNFKGLVFRICYL